MSRRRAAAGRAAGPQGPLKYLPAAIRVPAKPLRAIIVGWLAAFPPSIALAFLASFVFPEAARPEFHVDGTAAILALVVVAPVVETLIMGAVLLALLAFLSPAAAVIVSAVGWGVAHSLAAPVWGAVIWWPFLIFSTLFVAWRERSLALAFLIPMIVHALQNLGPALLLAYGEGAA